MRCKWSDCFTCPYPDCINDYIPPIRKASPETIKKRIQKMSLLRKERANNGLCTSCGLRPPRGGYKMCRECQVKSAKYKEKENKEKGITPRFMLDGTYLCQKCGKHPPACRNPAYPAYKRHTDPRNKLSSGFHLPCPVCGC